MIFDSRISVGYEKRCQRVKKMGDLKKITPSDSEWSDWKRQLEYAACTWSDLTSQEQRLVDPVSFNKAANKFPFFVTPYYRSLINEDDPDDPIRKMTFPSAAELANTESFTMDPICEEEHAVLQGVIRRYPDRVLLILGRSCAVNCRHCTRRVLGKGKVAPIPHDGLERFLEYLVNNPQIKDVIVSGGDPLLLEDDELIDVLQKIRSISSVEIIRIGTRTPVALPMRFSNSLAKRIAALAPVFINTQFNHPKEFTKESRLAVATLINAGIPVNNQSVLLKGVNDEPEIIEKLSRNLLKERIRPYYLFICDLVEGAAHFRTTVQRGVDIIAYLRGRISGMGIPELIIDLPGGVGKIPVGPNYMEKREGLKMIFKTPNGDQLIKYLDPPTSDSQ